MRSDRSESGSVGTTQIHRGYKHTLQHVVQEKGDVAIVVRGERLLRQAGRVIGINRHLNEYAVDVDCDLHVLTTSV